MHLTKTFFHYPIIVLVVLSSFNQSAHSAPTQPAFVKHHVRSSKPAAVSSGSGSGSTETLQNKLFKHIVSTVAKRVLATATQCPEGVDKTLCHVPAAFYVWLRQLQRRAIQEQIIKRKYQLKFIFLFHLILPFCLFQSHNKKWPK